MIMDTLVSNRNKVFLALGLGINSFSTLAFETIILKQLSFLMGSWDYILSVVLCSFMIGAGIGALIALNRKIIISFGYIVITQAISSLLTFVMLLRFDTVLTFSNNLVVIGLCLSPTFILFGYLITVVLDNFRREKPDFITWLYAADLVGAALGGILSVFIILPVFGLNKASLICIILFLFSGIFFTRKYTFNSIVSFCCVFAICFVFLFLRIDNFIERHRSIRHTPLYTLLNDGGSLLYTGWSPIQRIDIVKEHEGVVFTYNGFPWTSFPRFDDPVTVTSMLVCYKERFMKGLYPFVNSPRDILIIGAGAGPDIFSAKLWLENNFPGKITSGRGFITGVEIDPLVVNLMKNKFSDLNRCIYRDPRVKIVIDDGRHFLESTSGRFDLIHYPGVDTPFAFTNVLGVNPYLRAENFLYTYEGLQVAYNKLSDDGILMVTVGNWFPDAFDKLDFNKSIKEGLSRESRLLATYKRILEGAGAHRWTDYVSVAAYYFPHGQHNSMIDVMLKLSKKPIDRLQEKNFISSYRMPYGVYFFDSQTIESFASRNVPATDDRPFYYNFPLNDIPKVISQPLNFFLIVLLFYFTLIVIIFKFMKKAKGIYNYVLIFLFFVTVGISFMVAELLYAHQAALFLGNSFIGIAVFVPIMLFLSGLGSLIAGRVVKDGRLVLCLCLLLVAYSLFFSYRNVDLRALFAGNSLYFNAALFSLLFIPIGIVLGLFFPAGFIISSFLKPSVFVGWLYSLDILGSIVGILIGVCLPLQFGYAKSMYCLIVIFSVQTALLLWLRRLIL